MTAPLRPMSLGEILDRISQIYRSRFVAFALVAAIPTLIMDFILFADETWIHVASLVQPSWTKGGLFFWNSMVWLGFYQIFNVFYLLFEPAMIKIASGSVLVSEYSLASSLRFAANRWRSYLWIAVLKSAAILIVPELLAASMLIAEALFFIAKGSPKLTGFESVLVFVIPGLTGITLFLWCGACLSLALPVAALENHKGLKSLRRSWTLSNGTRTRVLCTWLVVYVSLWILTWGLEYLLGQLMFVVGSMLHMPETTRHFYQPAVFILATAIYVILGPIYPIAITLFYYDQRIRREGYDIERLMESAGMTAPLTPPQGEGIPAPAVPAPGIAPAASEGPHS